MNYINNIKSFLIINLYLLNTIYLKRDYYTYRNI